MAEAKRNLFTKKATDKLQSPDDLDKFVQVANPRAFFRQTTSPA